MLETSVQDTSVLNIKQRIVMIFVAETGNSRPKLSWTFTEDTELLMQLLNRQINKVNYNNATAPPELDHNQDPAQDTHKWSSHPQHLSSIKNNQQAPMLMR